MGKGTVKCNEEGCENYVVGWGLCAKHYKRWQRHGDSKTNLRPDDWGQREIHPLRDSWNEVKNKTKEGCCEEWHDFWVFVNDVGEKPSERCNLRRKDIKIPWSKANFFWHHWESKLKGGTPEYRREYQQKNHRLTAHHSLRNKYGITIDDYESMYESQTGLCAICGKIETFFDSKAGRIKKLAVDHCHSTGRVRGLLCNKCNHGIGKFEDNVEYLQSAIAYLNEHK